jgi:hypothetical protein
MRPGIATLPSVACRRGSTIPIWLVQRSNSSAFRPGQTYSRTDSRAPGAGTDLITTITDKTVYVDVK